MWQQHQRTSSTQRARKFTRMGVALARNVNPAGTLACACIATQQLEQAAVTWDRTGGGGKRLIKPSTQSHTHCHGALVEEVERCAKPVGVHTWGARRHEHPLWLLTSTSQVGEFCWNWSNCKTETLNCQMVNEQSQPAVRGVGSTASTLPDGRPARHVQRRIVGKS